MEEGFETRLALAALVIAIAAFLVSFSQAILEYLSSSESRNKCTSAAIGPWGTLVKWRWSFTDWKLKVYYPILDLTAEKLIDAVLKNEETRRLVFAMRMEDKLDNNDIRLQKKYRTFNFRRVPVERNEWVRWWHLGGHYDTLIAEDETMLKFTHLRYRDWPKFWWYRLVYPEQRNFDLPRASWAQILVAARIDIRNNKDISWKFADADTIPTQLDAPTQMMNVYEVGKIAFLLGVKSLTIDETGALKAFGDFGSITTEYVGPMGRVLRYDGDPFKLHISWATKSEHGRYRSYAWVTGRIGFGPFVSGKLFVPLSTISLAIEEGWGIAKFEAERGSLAAEINATSYQHGLHFREALLMRSLLEETRVSFVAERRDQYQYVTETVSFRDMVNQDWSHASLTSAPERWCSTTKLRAPTLYAAACFQSFHYSILGFPTTKLLEPMLPWIRQRAKTLAANWNTQPGPDPEPLLRPDINKVRPCWEHMWIGTYGWGSISTDEQDRGTRFIYDILTDPTEGNQSLFEKLKVLKNREHARKFIFDSFEAVEEVELVFREKWKHFSPEKRKEFQAAALVILRNHVEEKKGPRKTQSQLELDNFMRFLEINPEEIYKNSASDAKNTEEERSSWKIIGKYQEEVLEAAIGELRDCLLNFKPMDAIFIPNAVELLRKFEVQKWAAEVDCISHSVSDARPARIYLRSQLMVLDLLIRVRLRRLGWMGEIPIGSDKTKQTPEDKHTYFLDVWQAKKVVPAIVKAWKGTPDRPGWDIAAHLSDAIDEAQRPVTEATNSDIDNLAELLELRAIILLAFLCLHPDSSDVYAIDREILIPML